MRQSFLHAQNAEEIKNKVEIVVYIISIIVLLFITIEDSIYKEVSLLSVYCLIICGFILAICRENVAEILTYIMCGVICQTHSRGEEKKGNIDFLVIYGCLLIEGIKVIIVASVISLFLSSIVGLLLVAGGKSVKYKLPYTPFLLAGIAIAVRLILKVD